MCCIPHVEQLSCGPVSVVRLENLRPAHAYRPEDLSLWLSLADRVKTRKLLIDCSRVEFLSSEMLSRLILLQRRMKQSACEMVLCGLRHDVRQLLAWTKLDRFFAIEAEVKINLV